MIRRHEVLRTSFAWQKVARPVQVVLAEARPEWVFLDWRVCDPADFSEQLESCLAEDRARGLQLNAAPLARMTAVALAEERHLFIWTYHHVILDAWSASIVMSDVLAAYQGRLAKSDHEPPRFAQYLRHRAERNRQDAREFWTRYLDAVEPAAPRRAVEGPIHGPGRMCALERLADEDLSRAIRRFAREERRTFAHLVQAAWALLLHRFAEGDDVIFGWVISDRPADIEFVEEMVGLMVDTVPLRLQIDGARSVRDFLAHVAERSVDVAEHGHLPLTEIHALAGLQGGESLFDSIVVVENLPVEIAPEGEGDFAVFDRQAHWRTNYPLSLMAAFEGRLKLQITYDRTIHAEKAVEALLNGMFGQIEAMIADPAAPLDDLIRRLGPEPTPSLLGRAAAVSDECPSRRIVARLLAAPDREAIRLAGGPGFSAGWLAQAVADLSAALRGCGIAPGDAVAIELPRTPVLVAAMLAVLDCGAAFLPIASTVPEGRRGHMIGDGQVRLRLRPIANGRMVRTPLFLADLADPVYFQEAEGRRNAVPLETAYILYTSGSTGRPKGVAVSRRNLSNLLNSMADRPGLGPDDKLMATTMISFDIALLELLLPLVQGATLVLAPERVLREPDSVARFIKEYGVTVMQATPTAWRMLLDAGWMGAPSLSVWSGGEALDRDLADRLLSRTRAVWNLYGPTETTIWSLCARIGRDGRPIDLGQPVDNTEIWLSDRWGRRVAPGAVGEICIGGMGVALGYLGDPGNPAFVEDPSAPGRPSYRTGDLARQGEEGQLLYVGRSDRQVKIRGVRLELQGIESVLRGHPLISAAIVEPKMVAGGRDLVAYLITTQPVDDAALSAWLAVHLSEDERPSHFVRLESFPLTLNGKIDRAALPDPVVTEKLVPVAAKSRNIVEQIVQQVWSEVLGRPVTRPNDNFFALGGHSLKVLSAVAGINRALGTVVPLGLLFQHPTVNGFVSALEASLSADPGGARIDPARTERGLPQPLSSGQQRLWFVTKVDPLERPYVLAAAVRLLGTLDDARLAAAFLRLQDRHGILRTTFCEVEGRPMQTVGRGGQVGLERKLLRPNDGSPDAWLMQRIAEQTERDLPLATGVPARALLLRVSDREAVLLLVIHHILVDEWSLGLLIRDLGRCYEDLRLGVVAQEAAAPPDYVDYAVAEQRAIGNGAFTDHVAYWRGKMSGAPMTTIPTRHARPSVLAFNGGNLTAKLEGGLLEEVQNLARARSVTPFVVLLTGIFTLLHRYLARTDLCVGTMDGGRDNPAVEPIAGPFARPLPIRVDMREEGTFADHLSLVQQTVIEAWLHREAPLDQVVNSVGAAKRSNINPLFQIVVVMQNLQGFANTFEDIVVEPVPVDTGIAEFDLMIEMFEAAGGLTLRLSYNSNLYAAAEIELFVKRFENLLWTATDDPAVPVSAIDLLRHEVAALNPM